MTRLIDRRRRLVLETPLLIGKRPLVVLVEPWELALRQKGCHQNLSIKWAQGRKCRAYAGTAVGELASSTR
jgi:hypothetical protein